MEIWFGVWNIDIGRTAHHRARGVRLSFNTPPESAVNTGEPMLADIARWTAFDA